MTCPFRDNGKCTLTRSTVDEYDVNVDIPCADDAFVACGIADPPYNVNYVSLSVMYATLRQVVPDNAFERLREEILPALHHNRVHNKVAGGLLDGPGNELHLIVKNLGFEINPDCQCLATIHKMNRLGADWSINEGMAEIISVMADEGQKRKLTYSMVGVSIPSLSDQLIPRQVLETQARTWVSEACSNWKSKEKDKLLRA